MTAEIMLYEYAHARAGDKGDTLSIAVFPYRDEHYEWLVRELTTERVAECFAHRRPSRVTRYELPKLGALNFVLENALEGGVNRSPGIDRHGKALSYLLLSMRLPTPGALT